MRTTRSAKFGVSKASARAQAGRRGHGSRMTSMNGKYEWIRSMQSLWLIICALISLNALCPQASAYDYDSHVSEKINIVNDGSSIPGKRVKPCDLQFSLICKKDKSLCCGAGYKFPMTEVLKAVLPKKKGIRYEAQVPQMYDTLFCQVSSVEREKPRNKTKRTISQDSPSLIIDYLEAVEGSFENCIPSEYLSGTIVYWEVKTLPDGREVRDNRMKELKKYAINACNCRE
ncbi:uncharacterized protein LOC142338476 isoform X1 [Convolutriloba macropyga]|uniref:uncharacterized protein LOC142338476 isoform X1 n=1 Tax=Convolutriloba macropyga TaxID=536237 RepID=UPI003F5225F3